MGFKPPSRVSNLLPEFQTFYPSFIPPSRVSNLLPEFPTSFPSFKPAARISNLLLEFQPPAQVFIILPEFQTSCPGFNYSTRVSNLQFKFQSSNLLPEFENPSFKLPVRDSILMPEFQTPCQSFKPPARVSNLLPEFQTFYSSFKPSSQVSNLLPCFCTIQLKMLTKGVLKTIGTKHFNQRPAEAIIVWQKKRPITPIFEVLSFKFESCLNSNLTEIHFCQGRGCLFLACSEVCQRKSYLLIFKKDIAKHLLPLQGRAQVIQPF